jgi:hypothetical protein
MGPKTFQRIVDHMFSRRQQYYGMYGDCWDYPNYGGLPKSISSTLSCEAVDAMQDILQDKFARKRDFARAYKQRLFELGEPGKYQWAK